MPLLSSAVGTTITTSDDLITKRRLMSYAAAIVATDARFCDDTTAGSLVAFPTFASAIEWPASMALRELDALGLSADERQRALHIEQDTRICNTVRPGDNLACKATLVAVERRPSGVKTTVRIDITDGAGAAVATSYVGHLFRDVGLQGKECAVDLPPPWPQPETSLVWTETTVEVGRSLPHIYTECTGIWAPIHTERSAAIAAGLPDIIMHGSGTLAVAIRQILDALGQSDLYRVHRFACRFTGLVVPPTKLAIRYAVDEQGMLLFDVVTSTGQSVIANGRILISPCGLPC